MKVISSIKTMIAATTLMLSGRYVAAFSSRSSFTGSAILRHQQQASVSKCSARCYSRSTTTMKLQTAIVGLPNVGT